MHRIKLIGFLIGEENILKNLIPFFNGKKIYIKEKIIHKTILV
jgi:hypothetical protein